MHKEANQIHWLSILVAENIKTYNIPVAICRNKKMWTFYLGMCGNRISVQFWFLKTGTEPKPKGRTRNFGFHGFSQNRICLIQKSIFEPFSQSFNILHVTDSVAWLASYRDNYTIWFKLKFQIKLLKKHAFETNWAFRKLQNAHTRKTAYAFFRILQLIYKENRTDGSFQNRTETEPKLRFFSKPNRTWKINSAHP